MFVVVYIATINFLGLLTFGCRAVFTLVFTVSVTLVLSFVMLNCNYNILSHYCPELLSDEDYTNPDYGKVDGDGLVPFNSYSLFKGGFALAISLIEVFGVRIRAISLALRIVANLACGHILLTLYIGSVLAGDLSVPQYVNSDVDLAVDGALRYFVGLSQVLIYGFIVWSAHIDVVGADYVSGGSLFSLGALAVGAFLALCVLHYFTAHVVVTVFIFLAGLCLGMLESLVCAVQAYVFYALSLNYSRS